MMQEWKNKASNTTLFKYNDAKNKLDGGCFELLVDLSTPKQSAVTISTIPGPNAQPSDRYVITVGSMTTRTDYLVKSGATCRGVFDDVMTGASMGKVLG